MVRLRQLFPLAKPGAAIHYGVPFGASSPDNLLPNSGTHASDEITNEYWRRSRHIHDWIHVGTADWGLTIASDHQQIRLDDGVIRAEMLRGTRFTSVKVVRGDEVRRSTIRRRARTCSATRSPRRQATGKQSKAYRAGMGWNNPLLPVSVVDAVSTKSLPPSGSFCSVKQDDLVLSALKKSDLGPSVLLRVYEMEGRPVETPIEFLGRARAFGEVNLLEEDVGAPVGEVLRGGPYAIKTIRFDLGPPGRK